MPALTVTPARKERREVPCPAGEEKQGGLRKAGPTVTGDPTFRHLSLMSISKPEFCSWAQAVGWHNFN